MNDPRSSTHGERFAFVVFAVLCLALVAVEVPCALLAYHTLNADACAAQLVFVGLANLIPAVLFFLGRLRYSALSVALVIAFVIVPYDLALGWRMLQVQEEASDIVGWAYQQKLATGRFPGTLADYRFNRPGLRKYFEAYSAGEHWIYLEYYVGSEHAPHVYGGRWDYSAD